MTEQEALATSTNFIDIDGLLGYFAIRAANFLVGTGKYKFHQCCCWGYVLKKVK